MLLISLVAACGSDKPELSNFRCSPASLSLGASGPYTVTCDVDYDGSVGDIRWSAQSTASDTPWMSGTTADDTGHSLHFSMTKAEPPDQGAMNIYITVDPPAGTGGPGDDRAGTQIRVVPYLVVRLDERTQSIDRAVPLRRDVVEVALRLRQPARLELPDPLAPFLGGLHDACLGQCLEVLVALVS